MSLFEGKKVIIIGDRDGIPGPAIEKCIEGTGAEVVFSSTECFVWTAAGAMDLENQKRVKTLTEKHGAENILVILGAAEGEAAGLAAETVTNGDPTFAGPLSNVQLGLRVYHAVEPEFKEEVKEEVYDEEIGMMEMVLEVDEIIEEMTDIREEFCKFLD